MTKTTEMNTNCAVFKEVFSVLERATKILETIVMQNADKEKNEKDVSLPKDDEPIAQAKVESALSTFVNSLVSSYAPIIGRPDAASKDALDKNIKEPLHRTIGGLKGKTDDEKEFLKNKYDEKTDELNTLTIIESKKLEILTKAVQNNKELRSIDLADAIYMNQMHSFTETARVNIQGAAYKAMETQMRSLIESRKFSMGEFAKVIADQVKTELLGIAAKSAVWALYESAMGLATFGTPMSAAHFTAAGEFAVVSAGALAGAMGVQSFMAHNLNVGSASNPAPIHPMTLDDCEDVVMIAA